MPSTVTIPSHISNFLDLISFWDYDIPLSTQWTVGIVPEASSGGNDASRLFNIIKDYTQIDINNFYISTSIQQKLLGQKTQPNVDGIGLYYAMAAKLPRESFTPSYVGVDGMAGYLKGSVGGDRLDIGGRHLSIDFLETNTDFTDGLIRPWIIAAAYKGLINTGPNNSIKTTIMLREYARSSTSEKKPIRRTHVFSGCVPIDISEKTLNYSGEDVTTRTVNWIYQAYAFSVGSTQTNFDANALGF
jgi:hypothetical protein